MVGVRQRSLNRGLYVKVVDRGSQIPQVSSRIRSYVKGSCNWLCTLVIVLGN